METVSRLQLEPHPVSGELELFPEEGDDMIWYKRLDAETLQARCEVKEHGLAVVWVWCVNDTGGVGLEGAGEPENGWRVAEVLSLEDEEGQFDDAQRSGWFDTMAAAEEEASRHSPPPEEDQPSSQVQGNTLYARTQQPEVDDDDDYWASYDQTAGETPAQRSPAPRSLRASPEMTRDSTGRKQSTAEEDYYARYGDEVQPAMDGHDPDEEEASAAFESTLGGQSRLDNSNWQDLHQEGVAATEYASIMGSDEIGRYARARSETDATARQEQPRIHSPQPERPGSSGTRSPSPSVAALEASASSASAAEIGVKRHISMEIKALFRLAQGVGMEKEEFERVVRTELDCLSLTEL